MSLGAHEIQPRFAVACTEKPRCLRSPETTSYGSVAEYSGPVATVGALPLSTRPRDSPAFLCSVAGQNSGNADPDALGAGEGAALRLRRASCLGAAFCSVQAYTRRALGSTYACTAAPAGGSDGVRGARGQSAPPHLPGRGGRYLPTAPAAAAVPTPLLPRHTRGFSWGTCAQTPRGGAGAKNACWGGAAAPGVGTARGPRGLRQKASQPVVADRAGERPVEKPRIGCGTSPPIGAGELIWHWRPAGEPVTEACDVRRAAVSVVRLWWPPQAGLLASLHAISMAARQRRVGRVRGRLGCKTRPRASVALPLAHASGRLASPSVVSSRRAAVHSARSHSLPRYAIVQGSKDLPAGRHAGISCSGWSAGEVFCQHRWAGVTQKGFPCHNTVVSRAEERRNGCALQTPKPSRVLSGICAVLDSSCGGSALRQGHEQARVS